ncbi:MAG TPA: sigma-70 family RNA polymerase sigma factor [Caldisericia bacterium]|nr:sigma-70 family RNA polymerase sigma factor [Caldisericia bacterium]
MTDIKFNEYYEKYFFKLVDRIKDRGFDYDRAKDLAQDTMLWAYENIEKYNPDAGSFWTWINMKLRQIIYDYNQGHESKAIQFSQLSESEQKFITNIPTPQVSVEEIIIDKIDTEVMLSGYSSDQKRAYELYLQGLTQQEIADEIGVSQPTISNWINIVNMDGFKR